jgi:hypothetical protein
MTPTRILDLTTISRRLRIAEPPTLPTIPELTVMPPESIMTLPLPAQGYSVVAPNQPPGLDIIQLWHDCRKDLRTIDYLFPNQRTEPVHDPKTFVINIFSRIVANPNKFSIDSVLWVYAGTLLESRLDLEGIGELTYQEIGGYPRLVFKAELTCMTGSGSNLLEGTIGQARVTSVWDEPVTPRGTDAAWDDYTFRIRHSVWAFALPHQKAILLDDSIRRD